MRVIKDSFGVVQVTKDPDVGDYIVSNGLEVLDFPPGVEVDEPAGISDWDTFVNTDYGLISLYPGFDGIQPNTMRTADDYGGITLYPDIWSLDLTGTVDNLSGSILPAPYNAVLDTRAQTGSFNPNQSTLLPLNSVSNEPGMLVTNSLDLTAATGGLGADQFMVYWKIYTYTVTQESTGGSSNVPVYKLLNEIDQEPVYFTVGISIDGGDFEPVNLMETYYAPVAGTAIKLCFLSTHTEKLYLAHFAMMFKTA